MLCFSSILFIQPSLSTLQKFEVKCIILYLYASIKFWNARKAYRYPVLMSNFRNCYMSQPCETGEQFVISQFQMVCGSRDAAATRDVSSERNLKLNSILVNILKSVTRTKQISGGIRSDQTDRQSLDTLGRLRYYHKQYLIKTQKWTAYTLTRIANNYQKHLYHSD